MDVQSEPRGDWMGRVDFDQSILFKGPINSSVCVKVSKEDSFLS